MSGTVAKPILRGMVKNYIIRSFLQMACVSCFAGWSYKHWIADPRKKAYKDFYVNYNAEEEAERLYRMGLIRGWDDNEDVPEERFKIAVQSV